MNFTDFLEDLQNERPKSQAARLLGCMSNCEKFIQSFWHDAQKMELINKFQITCFIFSGKLSESGIQINNIYTDPNSKHKKNARELRDLHISCAPSSKKGPRSSPLLEKVKKGRK